MHIGDLVTLRNPEYDDAGAVGIIIDIVSMTPDWCKILWLDLGIPHIERRNTIKVISKAKTERQRKV